MPEKTRPMKLKIRNARVRHLQVPIDREVVTAFGVMTARHAIVLEIDDGEGHTGLGESWINFPHWAPAERVAAFERAFIPYLEGRDVDNVAAFAEGMYRDFRGPAVQSGTVGPLLCSLCAVELALWDLAAKCAGVPLNRLLLDRPADEVRVYASGINSPLPFDLIDEHLDAGIDLFKLKLGFDDKTDRANIDALTRHLGTRARIAVDVNRGWTLDEAVRWLDVLADHDVVWLEEPLCVEDERSLRTLFEQDRVPIALGENTLLSPDADPALLTDAPGHILQPDLTKYAPLHVVLKALPDALAGGRRVVPHFLGSAPGLAASIHFASGLPEPLCELDINGNALRTELMDPPFEIVDGKIRIPGEPGIGWRMKTPG